MNLVNSFSVVTATRTTSPIDAPISPDTPYPQHKVLGAVTLFERVSILTISDEGTRYLELIKDASAILFVPVIRSI